MASYFIPRASHAAAWSTRQRNDRRNELARQRKLIQTEPTLNICLFGYSLATTSAVLLLLHYHSIMLVWSIGARAASSKS
jgi:hypothetical protein